MINNLGTDHFKFSKNINNGCSLYEVNIYDQNQGIYFKFEYLDELIELLLKAKELL